MVTLGKVVIAGLTILAIGTIASKLLAKDKDKDVEEEGKQPPKERRPASSEPGKKSQEHPKSKDVQPPANQSRNLYRTAPSQARVPSAGWLPLSSGGSVTVEPLIDAGTGLYARLSYADAAGFAKNLGAELLTMPQVLEVWKVGKRLAPCTLPHDGPMQSLEYAKRHDECVRKQLADWDGRTLVANAGKDWIRGASALGRGSRNGGWIKPDGTAIQGGSAATLRADGTAQLNSEHHEATYTDYSQLTRLWKPA